MYESLAGAPHRERSLWCAVIEQAFIDAGLIVAFWTRTRPKTGMDAPGRAAKEWLLYSDDLHMICSLAGLEGSVVRKCARDKMLQKLRNHND